MMIGRRLALRAGGGALAAMLGVALVLAPSGAVAGASVASPTFSATGVCVSGVPEFAFTVTGLPAGQDTVVTLALNDGPDETQTTTASLGSGFATVLWNTHSALFGAGLHIVAVEVAGTWIAATNLTAAPNQTIANSYDITLPTCATAASKVVGLAPTNDGLGYWETTANGQVLAFGDAHWFGSLSGTALDAPIVGIVANPAGTGYWLVAADGGVFSFGGAQYWGSAGNTRLNAPVVGMAATANGQGYWLVASDGGVFTYGTASFWGSAGATKLVAPVVGIAPTPDGNGYFLAASDGGVFTYGDANFHGSAASLHLAAAVVGVTATSVDGYRLVASDGGVFDFGTDAFQGSLGGTVLAAPIAGFADSPDGGGYWMVGADGGVFALGNAGFAGTAAGAPTV